MNKYNNRKIVFEGITFDSEKEKDRYVFLREKERTGAINDLKRQITFELLPAIKHEEIVHLKTKDKTVVRTDQLPITYKCDFAYMRNGIYVVEDVKASAYMLPKEFVLKEKMFFAKYGFRIAKIYKYNEWNNPD